MENKIKVKANLSFVKKTAKSAVEQIKASPDYEKMTLADIEALDFGVEQGEVSKEVSEAIKNLIVAYLYLDKSEKHVTERLRPGYIGQEIRTNNTVSYQTVRGVPYGTIVSIPTEDGRSVIGISYFGKNDRFATPVVGEYVALKRAIDGRKNGFHGAEQKYVRPEAKAQIDHFYKRSLAYWNPDKYSHSRGTEPVDYSDFDKIHENQLRILGKDKVRDMATRPSPKLIGEMNRKGDISDYKQFLTTKPEKGDYYVYVGSGSMLVESTDSHPTRTKSTIVLEPNDWLYYDGYTWSVIPNGMKSE